MAGLKRERRWHIMAETRDVFELWQNGEISRDEYEDSVAEILHELGVRS